ncbi:hypothetical protein G6F65_021329 [Rhizopus arrhizus]|nr:hypothetical protein G6F65_021329 [Rhizopus arrhizus]
MAMQRRGHDARQAIEQHRDEQQAQEDQPGIVATHEFEGRHRQHQQAQAARQQKGLAPHLVAGETDDRLHEQHADHDHDDDQHPVLFGIPQTARQISSALRYLEKISRNDTVGRSCTAS